MVSLRRTLSSITNSRFKENQGDKSLIIIVGIIIAFGLVMLSSASSIEAYKSYGDSYYFFKHQLVGLIMGLIIYWFFSRIDYHKWRKYAWLMLIFSIVLLILVFIPGLKSDWGRAHSWIKIFGFSLQPAEFVKITFLIYLAAWLESRRNNLSDIAQGVGPFLLVLGIIAGLMILQPDIGTLLIITLISLIVYFVGGGRLKHLALIIIAGIAVLAVLVSINSYQANRFKCLINANLLRYKQDICYQVNQSLIAVGSGGFWGRGLGASRQKYAYLPEVKGDSIFAIIGEETGLIFSVALVILYLFFFYRGFLIAKHSSDDFGRILAIGIVSWITFQALINIGGMINLIPLTGVTLPFISFGGTSLMVNLGVVGILVNISKHGRGVKITNYQL